MGVYIAASTVVNGAVLAVRANRCGSELMDSACTNDDGYVFRWSAARSDGTAVALDPSTTYSNTPQLYLPKRSLPPGVSYTLRFEGRQASNPRVSAAAEFDFYVRAAALEAIVAGGDALLAENVPLTLDASASVDPDQETEYEWDFSWLCEATTPATGDCLTTDGARLALPVRSGAGGYLLQGATTGRPDVRVHAHRAQRLEEGVSHHDRRGLRGARRRGRASGCRAAVPGGRRGERASSRAPPRRWSRRQTRGPHAALVRHAHARRRRGRAGGRGRRRIRRVHVARRGSRRSRRTRWPGSVPLPAGRVGRQRRGGVPDAPQERPAGRRQLVVSPQTGTALSTVGHRRGLGRDDGRPPQVHRARRRRARRRRDAAPGPAPRVVPGTLPGGLDAEGGAVVVAVRVRDAQPPRGGGVSRPPGPRWPRGAATEATVAAVRRRSAHQSRRASRL